MQIQSAFLPKRPTIDGNAILAAMQAQRERLLQNYGRIANRSTGQVVEKIGNTPITQNPQRLAKVDKGQRVGSLPSPSDALHQMVQRYNDYISTNDLNEERIEYADYFNRDSPNHLDQNDPQGIDAEGQYLQNQLYRLKGDKRYVPTDEDISEMSDEDFIKFEEKYLQ